MCYAEKGDTALTDTLVWMRCPKCGRRVGALEGSTGYCFHYGTQWDTRGKSSTGAAVMRKENLKSGVRQGKESVGGR